MPLAATRPSTRTTIWSARRRADRRWDTARQVRVLPGRARAGVQTLTRLFTACVAGIVAFHAARFVASDYAAGSPGVGVLPAWLLELVIPAAFAMISLRYAILWGLALRTLLARGSAAPP